MGTAKGIPNPEQYLLGDGTTRMSLAKKILVEEIIPTLEFVSKITVRKFHAEGNTDILNLQIIYDSAKDPKEQLLSKILAIPDPEATGGTPISQALRVSFEALKLNPEQDRKIILITDGEETGGGNYETAVVEMSKESGIECSIFIIGICQNEQAKTKSRKLGQNTNGGFIDVHSKAYDRDEIKKDLRPLRSRIIEESLEAYSKPSGNFSQPTVLEQPAVKIEGNQKDVIQANSLVTQQDSISQALEVKIDEVIETNSSGMALVAEHLKILNEGILEITQKISQIEQTSQVSEFENIEEQSRIGRKCEEMLFKILKQKYGDRVSWLNQDQEHYGDLDFEIDDLEGTIEYHIECKGTKGKLFEFQLTKREWTHFLSNTKNYQVYFFVSADENPHYLKIDNLLDWILKGKVLPCFSHDATLRKDRIPFQLNVEENDLRPVPI
jgi:hypothetical protein